VSDLAWLLSKFVNDLVTALPWVLGGASLVAIVTFGPLGRALIRFLRSNRRETGLTEGLLAELASTRQLLGEVLERLDAAERAVTGSGPGKGRVVAAESHEQTATRTRPLLDADEPSRSHIPGA
jgi:hypothetical protein